MTVFIGSELPGPRLNVFRRRAATNEEVHSGRECNECLRCSIVHDNGGKTKGLRCMIHGDWTKRFLVCDAFAPPPGEVK
ncbi:MAG: hypothetical protein ACLP9L_41635 [Thermoguttaceae bacterium]